MTESTVKQTGILQQCSEELLHTVPRLFHCFKPNAAFPLHAGGQLSIGQGRLLMAISHGHCSVSDLAEKSRVSLPTISRKIDLLVEKGMVTRRRDPEDRRALVLEITDEGQRVMEQHRQHANLQLSKYLESLTEEELLQIMQSLKLLRKAFGLSETESDSCP
jgi:DNA-binding MarR family transcriptional regulator